MTKFLIIHPEGNPLANPTMLSLLEELKKRSHESVFIGKRSPYSPTLSLVGGLLLYSRLRHYLYRILGKLGLHEASARVLALGLAERIARFDPEILIVVDREGQLIANRIKSISNVPRVYLSFEILFEAETSQRYKAIEKRHGAKVAIAVVQDSQRAELLIRENGFAAESVRLLPLGSQGKPLAPGFRVRDILGIPAKKRVALFLGSLAEWSGLPAILSSVSEWPDDWVLLVNSRDGHAKKIRKWLRRLDYKTRARVFVNSQFFPRVDELQDLMAGIDVGCAFYFPNDKSPYHGKNLEVIGWASGKISTFLRHGIPVISNVGGEVRDAIRENGVGFSVGDATEISTQLMRYLGGPPGERCQEFFHQRIDFEVFGAPLVSDVEKLASGNNH